MDPARLLKNADLALYRAKANGRDKFEFFHRNMKEQIVARMKMERELRNVIVKNELSPHYQPQSEIRKGGIVGAEALIRWRKKNGEWCRPTNSFQSSKTAG